MENDYISEDYILKEAVLIKVWKADLDKEDEEWLNEQIKSIPGANVLPVEWISVEEQMPEQYHPVLCYGINGMMVDYYSGETSACGTPLFMISGTNVTHWMPLPEPPKEADNGK